MARVEQPGALANNAAMVSQDQIDPNPINNSDAESVNAAPAADLRVTKAVSDAAPGVGALVTYTIAVTNLGPNDATSADVSDVLPAGVAFVSARHHRAATTRNGPLDTGRRAGYPDRDIDGDGARYGTSHPGQHGDAPVEHTVDPNAANDTGTATLISSIVADVSLTKTPSAPVAAAGTPFTWTVAVLNDGRRAVGASVTDSFPRRSPA